MSVRCNHDIHEDACGGGKNQLRTGENIYPVMVQPSLQFQASLNSPSFHAARLDTDHYETIYQQTRREWPIPNASLLRGGFGPSRQTQPEPGLEFRVVLDALRKNHLLWSAVPGRGGYGSRSIMVRCMESGCRRAASMQRTR